MINIENIEEVSRLVIQAKDKNKEDDWYTVSNLPIDTHWSKGLLEMKGWKKDFPNGTFRLIRADIIVKIETIEQI
jgi:hypothetical protein